MKLLTTHQVAEHLNLSEQRIRAMCAAGRLPAQKFGRQWLIQQKDLDKFQPRPRGRQRVS